MWKTYDYSWIGQKAVQHINKEAAMRYVGSAKVVRIDEQRRIIFFRGEVLL